MRVGSVSHLRRLASLTAQHDSRYNVPENGAAAGGPRPTRPVRGSTGGRARRSGLPRGKIKIAIADTRLTYD
jgi:hypothetical protein